MLSNEEENNENNENRFQAPYISRQRAFNLNSPTYKSISDLTFEPFISENELFQITSNIANEINHDYEDTHKTSPPIILGVLNGAFIFLSDLAKKLTIDCEFHFIKVASYEGTESSGEIKEIIGLTQDIDDRDILIVEDIIDTGFTIQKIKAKLQLKNPRSIKICTLLYKDKKDKKDQHSKESQHFNSILSSPLSSLSTPSSPLSLSTPSSPFPFQIDYVGKIIPDKFVIGYGLDYNNLGRNSNSIYILPE